MERKIFKYLDSDEEAIEREEEESETPERIEAVEGEKNPIYFEETRGEL